MTTFALAIDLRMLVRRARLNSGASSRPKTPRSSSSVFVRVQTVPSPLAS
ncbi:MAG TPA: hypothetical protein VMP67_09160 [Candidatus Limnocylindria bacterium]|nr:hypothetical protein [Candidatus Limnocylindria bacterium]